MQDIQPAVGTAALLRVAVAALATMLGPVDGSGLHLAGRFLDTDETMTQKAGTIMETLPGAIGLTLVLVGSILL